MKSRLAVVTLALALGFGSAANAATINLSFLTGTVYTTAGMDSFATNSPDMNGMLVTAVWENTSTLVQTSLTQAWASGVTFSGSGFDLVMPDSDSYPALGGEWELDFTITGATYVLRSLTFDGKPGNTAFDRCWDPAEEPCSTFIFGDLGDEGTAGSNVGFTFAGFSSSSVTINATYTDMLKLNSAVNPVGDLFTKLILNFAGAGLGEGDYTFLMDTDNVAVAGDINPTISQVPEPGTMLLLGTGLLGLAAAARRRRLAARS